MMRINLLRFPVAIPTEDEKIISRYLPVVCHTAIVPKNPLRWIVSRTPVYLDLYEDGTKKLAFYRHVLVCGHERHVFGLDGPESGRWRHRCAECAENNTKNEQSLTLPPKKPSASVTMPIDRKRAA